MHLRNLVLLLFSFTLSWSHCDAQLYTFKNFNHKDGLDVSNITSIAQTDDGLLWLGTFNSGIIKFNGKKFEEIHFKNKDNNHHITSINKSNKGVVYFSSRYKGFYKLENNKTFLIHKNYRDDGDYIGIYPFNEAILLVCEKSISLYKNGKIIVRKSTKSRNEKIKITQFIKTPNGAILLTENSGFYISKDNKIISLNNYLKVKETELSDYTYGNYSNQKITLFSRELNKKFEILINSKGEVWSKLVQYLQSPLIKGDQAKAYIFDVKHKKNIFITQKGNLYIYSNNYYFQISQNSVEKIVNCQSILSDLYGDLWVSSSIKGIYKVSMDPFTKIELDPVYKNSVTTLIFKSKNDHVIIGNEGGQTSINSNKNEFKTYNFTAYSASELNKIIYLGTNEGVKLYNTESRSLTELSLPPLKNKKIQFVFTDDITIWFGIKGEGLLRYNPISKQITTCRNLYSGFPTDFYTAQKSFDNKIILFGSNNGIHQFNLTTKTFNHINDFPEALGVYSGNSTIDSYGTRWFTLDKGIVGFTRKNRRRTIQDIKKIISFNIYTLNSDLNGNLIIGTNKGITILKLNKQGNVVHSKLYNNQTGFSGYETRIRSQYQHKNIIYVGTIEGVYLINTSSLENLPIPSMPFIERIKYNDKLSIKKIDSYYFDFKINNPKIDFIEYSYQLKGIDNNWSKLSSETSVNFSELTDNIYTFQVKASYDGTHFSSISSYTFKITNPFWTSTIFIVSIIILFALLNLYLLRKIKSFDTKTIFSNKDNTITTKLMPRIIFTSTAVNLVMHFTGYFLDKTIPFHTSLIIISSILLLLLFILSSITAKQNKPNLTKNLLIIGFSISLIQNFTELYLSSLHPFFIITIAVLSPLIPFIFEKVRSSILYSICILLVSCLCFIFPDDVHFNKYLLILTMVLIVCISIFATYLRHDSISKLLFISGVINKGNVITIAINDSDKIIYASENISDFIQTNHDEILNKDISYLANYLPLDNEVTIYSGAHFKDGKKYLAPMISLKKEVIWVEWSCKVFSEEVKVILGQDVTKKMELETTFELLVQNAEDFIYQCDIKGNFVFLNKQAIIRTGYSERELIGKNYNKIVVEKNLEDVVNYYKVHFLNKQGASYFEFPIHTKSGEEIWLGQHVTTLYEAGSKKRVKGFLAVARDITEKRKQEKLIEEQQKDITSSIHYAKRIQLNLLPNQEQFNKSFEESSIIFKPKDIVSGDFYWMEKINDTTIFALGDCTGHGVPGSFMTLLGINLLNSIVLEGQNLSPGKILDELDEKLVSILPRGDGDNKVNDGMEISICVFNHSKNTLTYACAGSRFLLLKDGQFNVYKLNNKHIGDLREPNFKGYDEQTISITNSDVIYMYSDGFQDQFGGEKNKKFNFKKILSIITENINKPIASQATILEFELNKWMGEYEQTDDITLITFKGLVNTKK